MAFDSPDNVRGDHCRHARSCRRICGGDRILCVSDNGTHWVWRCTGFCNSRFNNLFCIRIKLFRFVCRECPIFCRVHVNRYEHTRLWIDLYRH